MQLVFTFLLLANNWAIQNYNTLSHVQLLQNFETQIMLNISQSHHIPIMRWYFAWAGKLPKSNTIIVPQTYVNNIIFCKCLYKRSLSILDSCSFFGLFIYTDLLSSWFSHVLRIEKQFRSSLIYRIHLRSGILFSIFIFCCREIKTNFILFFKIYIP